MTTATPNDIAAVHARCFVQAMQAALFHAREAMLAHARAAAQPTPESATATRRSVRAMGLGSLLTSTPKPTADERRTAVHIARTSALGFDRGRFVGGAA